MASRWEDWLKQARHDLEQAAHSLSGGYYDWACFAAHQAAEKALKALFQRQGSEARGHSISGLLSAVSGARPDPSLMEAAKELERHYVPSRYPNSYSEGAPSDFYTAVEAERAIANARAILRFCEDNLLR